MSTHFGLYHVHNGLRLGKIDPSIEECTLGKFSRLGNNGSVFQHSFQYLFMAKTPPWQSISMVSSPVYVRGPRMAMTSTSSTILRYHKYIHNGWCGLGRFQRFFPPLERYTPDAISKASGPLILTIPIPDALMAVEIAAIVVSSIFHSPLSNG